MTSLKMFIPNFFDAMWALSEKEMAEGPGVPYHSCGYCQNMESMEQNASLGHVSRAFYG